MAERNRLLRFATRRRGGGKSEPAAAAAKPVGRSGTVNTGGFITDEEFNSALTWPKNLTVYDRMRKTDATTRWMLALLKGPARAAGRAVDPPKNPDDVEREATAFVEHALFEELDGGFDDLLRRLLTYLEMGHSAGERLVELREVEFDVEEEELKLVEQPAPPAPAPDGAGDAPPPPQLPPPPPPPPKPVRHQSTRTVKRDAFVITRVEERLQRTIYRWNPVPGDPAKLESVELRLNDGITPNNPEVEASRLVILVCDKEGDNWRGNSILRSVWRPYEYKSRLENIEAIGFDRSAGLPVAYPPDSADDDQVDAVEEMLQAIRQGESLYMVMPGPKQQGADKGEGWLVEDLAIKGDADNPPDKAINRYVSEIARNIAAEFMRLGQEGRTGARATGEVQQDPYYAGIEAVVHYLEDVINEALVRPLCDWNYELRRYPRFRFSKIHAKSIEVVTKAVAELVSQGAVEATPELEAWLRDLLDAPEKPQELEEGAAGVAETVPARDPARDPSEADAPGETGGGREAMARVRFAQFMPRRPLQGGERFVAWDQVQATLDNGPEDLVAIGERVMGGQIESASALADQAVRLNRPEDLDRVALDPGPLADALETELARLYSAGAADVRAEVRRQLRAAGQDPGDMMAIPPRIPLSNADIAKVLGGIAKNMAESAAQSAVRAIKQRALKTIAQRRETPPVPGEDPMAALRASLRLGATPAVNRIYTLGRMDELRSLAHAGDVDALRYSAILDGATCEPCEDWDGTVVRPEEAIDLPNPDCEGGDKCRCQWVAETVAPGELGLG